MKKRWVNKLAAFGLSIAMVLSCWVPAYAGTEVQETAAGISTEAEITETDVVDQTSDEVPVNTETELQLPKNNVENDMVQETVPEISADQGAGESAKEDNLTETTDQEIMLVEATEAAEETGEASSEESSEVLPVNLDFYTDDDPQLFSDETSFNVYLNADGSYDTVKWSVFLGKQEEADLEPEKITEDLAADYLTDEGATAHINVQKILKAYQNDMPVSDFRIIVGATVYSGEQEVGSGDFSYSVTEPYCEISFAWNEPIKKVVSNDMITASTEIQCIVYNSENPYGNYNCYGNITEVSSSDESVLTAIIYEENRYIEVTGHAFGTAELTFSYECPAYPEINGSFTRAFQVVDREYQVENVYSSDNSRYILPGEQKDYTISFFRTYSTGESTETVYDLAEGDSFRYELMHGPEGCEISIDPNDPLHFTLKVPEAESEYSYVSIKAQFIDSAGEVLSEQEVNVADISSSYYRVVLYDSENNPIRSLHMTDGDKMIIRPKLYLVTADGETPCEDVVWEDWSGGLLSVTPQGDGTFLATAMGNGTGSLGVWYIIGDKADNNWFPITVDPDTCEHDWANPVLQSVPEEGKPGTLTWTCSNCGRENNWEVGFPDCSETAYATSDETFFNLVGLMFGNLLGNISRAGAYNIIQFTRLYYDLDSSTSPAVYMRLQDFLKMADSLFAVHTDLQAELEADENILVDTEKDTVIFLSSTGGFGDPDHIQLLSVEGTGTRRTLHGQWLTDPTSEKPDGIEGVDYAAETVVADGQTVTTYYSIGEKVRLVLNADHQIQAYEADVDEITSLTFDGLDNSGLNYSWDSIAYDHMMLYYDVFKDGEYVTGSSQGTNTKINKDSVPWYNLLSSVLGRDAGEGTYDVTVALETYDEDDNLIARGVDSSGNFTISSFDLVSLPFAYGPEGRDVLIGDAGYSIETNVNTRFDVAVDGLDEPVNVNVYNLVYITEIENSDSSILSVARNEVNFTYDVKGLKAGTSKLTLHYTYRGEEKTYSYPVNVKDTYYEYRLDYDWPYLISGYADGRNIEMVSGEEVDVTAAISEYKYNAETESWDNMGDVTDQVEFTWTNPLYPEGDGPLQIEADGKYCKVTAKPTDVTRMAMLAVNVEKNGNRCVTKVAFGGGFVAYIYKELYRQKIFVNGSEAAGTGNTVPILLKEDETAEIRPVVWLDKAGGIREEVDDVYCFLAVPDNSDLVVKSELAEVGGQTLYKTPFQVTQTGSRSVEGYLTLYNVEGTKIGSKALKFVSVDNAFAEVDTTVIYQPGITADTGILPDMTYTAEITVFNDQKFDFDNVEPFFQIIDDVSGKMLSADGDKFKLAVGETKTITLSLTMPMDYFAEGTEVVVTAGVGRKSYSSVDPVDGKVPVATLISQTAQDSEITVKTSAANQTFLDDNTFTAEPTDLSAEATEGLTISIARESDLDVQKMLTYDLKFVDAGGAAVPVSPEDGKAFGVTIPIPEEWLAHQILVYYYDESAGTFEKIPCTVDASSCTVSFATDHFSSYSVVCADEHTHIWVDGAITKEPTCTEEGTQERTCSVCGESETKVLPALGHSFEETVTPATLSEDGRIENKCTRCGKVESSTVIPKVSEIKLSATSYVYDGKGKKPAVTVKDSAGNAIDTKYYTVTPDTNVKAIGKYTVTVTFKGLYCGKKKLSFKIIPSATKASLENTASGVKIKWNKVSGVNGYVIYKNGEPYKKVAATSTSYTDKAAKTNGKTYTYKVCTYKTVKEEDIPSKASASVKYVFLTRPTVKSAKNSASRKMTVTWNRNTKATGYQIRYVTGTKTKTVKVTSNKTVSKVISSLVKGKTYKVDVRSYKTVSGKTYYSAWSAAKSVKITK